MGLMKMLFGIGKGPQLEPGAWLVGLREGAWQTVTSSTYEISENSCIRDNGNDFFVLRQIEDTSGKKYLGCVRLTGSQEVMVLVERLEGADQVSPSGDFWSYDRVLTAKNTPEFAVLLQQIGQIHLKRVRADKPAYLEHLVKGLEAMAG
jgi:hypothetical protein